MTRRRYPSGMGLVRCLCCNGVGQLVGMPAQGKVEAVWPRSCGPCLPWSMVEWIVPLDDLAREMLAMKDTPC